MELSMKVRKFKMNKLYIYRFSTGGGNPEEQDFYVTVTYEPQYENGVCTAVRVTCTGSINLGGVYDQNGNNVSENWSDAFPTNPVYAIYLQNMSETLTFHSRWNQEYTTTIEVTQIGSSEGGDDPTPTPEPENPNPEYELFNELLYGRNETLPLSDVVIDGKHIAEIWYNGKMVWGYREVDPTTKPFNFTIDEVQYTATPGMTWSQWKASSYGESTEYIISGNYVENWRGNRVYRMSSGTVWAMSTDEIIRNGEYYCNM
jgi:hypothetical protein